MNDLTDTLASSFPWLPAYGGDPQTQHHQTDIADIGYLSRSVMLEPIMEETSDDDEASGDMTANAWSSQYESTWSSESDTGSVIRVEINQGKHYAFNYIIFKIIKK